MVVEEEDREWSGGKKRWREFSSCLMDHLSSETAGAAPVTDAVALTEVHKGEGPPGFLHNSGRSSEIS